VWGVASLGRKLTRLIPIAFYEFACMDSKLPRYGVTSIMLRGGWVTSPEEKVIVDCSVFRVPEICCSVS
jgi:hypothetical protein